MNYFGGYFGESGSVTFPADAKAVPTRQLSQASPSVVAPAKAAPLANASAIPAGNAVPVRAIERANK